MKKVDHSRVEADDTETKQEITSFMRQKYKNSKYTLRKFKNLASERQSDEELVHGAAQIKYDPSAFKNSNGQFDFSIAPNYDEDLVRANIKYV